MSAGQTEAARAYFDEAERLFRDLGNRAIVARIQYYRASLALDQGDVEAARRDLVQALSRFIELTRGNAPDWRVIERMGTLALRRGKPARAARLFAVAQARHQGVPGPVDPAERDLRAGDT